MNVLIKLLLTNKFMIEDAIAENNAHGKPTIAILYFVTRAIGQE
jgi:hypothetical protein